MDRITIDEAWIARLVPPYEQLLARFMLGETSAERARALADAGALARWRARWRAGAHAGAGAFGGRAAA